MGYTREGRAREGRRQLKVEVVSGQHMLLQKLSFSLPSFHKTLETKILFKFHREIIIIIRANEWLGQFIVSEFELGDM